MSLAISKISLCFIEFLLEERSMTVQPMSNLTGVLPLNKEKECN